MSIVIDDPSLEDLAKKLAAAEGTSVEIVIRDSLLSRAGRRGEAVHDRPLRDRLAELAREVDAVQRFGKGRGHPAQLNMGEGAVYALAKTLNEPLLYVGGDFSQTDLEIC
jgi:uncharacterized protein with PIN domain